MDEGLGFLIQIRNLLGSQGPAGFLISWGVIHILDIGQFLICFEERSFIQGLQGAGLQATRFEEWQLLRLCLKLWVFTLLKVEAKNHEKQMQVATEERPLFLFLFAA